MIIYNVLLQQDKVAPPVRDWDSVCWDARPLGTEGKSDGVRDSIISVGSTRSAASEILPLSSHEKSTAFIVGSDR